MLRFSAATICLLFFLPHRTAAQGTPEPADSTPTVLPTIEVHGAPSTPYLQRVTRTATRTNTLLRDVPQSVTVITKNAIADQRMQGMADVVRYVPGVTMG
jgi:catecholate siderophore receptor